MSPVELLCAAALSFTVGFTVTNLYLWAVGR